MKMTNIEAENRLKKLQELVNNKNELPAVVGFKIYQNIQALQNAVHPYLQARDDVVMKYAKDGKTSISETDDPETFRRCVIDIAALENEIIDVDIKTFKFNLIEKFSFPLDFFVTIGFMLEG